MDIEGFKFINCSNHFFHKECIYNNLVSLNGEYANLYTYKCCICSQQYGQVKGEMPNGIMKW